MSISIERAGVFNLENAMRGARNPMNSWERMDSAPGPDGAFALGAKDLELAQKLCRAGSDHRKFMRQVFVSADIRAPIYWWKEFDTYKVGTVSNSTSTMHKIHTKSFTREDFSTDRLDDGGKEALDAMITYLEGERRRFLETRDKGHWWNIIQLLPSGYMQLRTCTMNYENLRGMYFARKGHKLDEWRAFCAWVENLPYGRELICLE